MASKSLQRRYKVISIGEGRVGKTSMLHRMIGLEFDALQRSSCQAAYHENILDLVHTIEGGEQQYSISAYLWDTCGQERFHALAPLYYRDAHCVIIVFDVTDRKSFKCIKHWFDECMRILKSSNNKISIAIVGNKIDLENQRQVSYQEGIELCEALADNDEYFNINTDGMGPKQCRDKCQKLCDGFIRRSECELWSPPNFWYSFNLTQNIFAVKSEHICFIPMDIYRLCFKFYFVGQKSIIGYYETSAKTNDGMKDMLESLIRTRLDIDYYHPPPKPRRDYCGDWLTDAEEIEYTKQSSGLWGVFTYVSDWLSSYL